MDSFSLILVSKLNLFNLLKEKYSESSIPMSVYNKAIIESIEQVDNLGSNMDDALAEGCIMFEDPNTDSIMKVDRKESETGIKLSMDEEEAVALALQMNVEVLLTNDQEVAKMADLLGISTIGIPTILLWASKNRKVTKPEILDLCEKSFKENFKMESESLPSLYDAILNSKS
jgi:predicted nucleic acid-binding protein